MNHLKIGIALVSLLVILGIFQNCGSTKSTGGSNTQLSVYDSVDLFSKTLHPVLMDNCAACHGSTQTPMFAVTDAQDALHTIQEYSLVDINNPANSRFVKKIKEGHNNFPQSLADEVQAAIEEWAGSPTPPPSDDDFQSPTVQVTAPAANATVNGTVAVQVNANDNVAVTRVILHVDGVSKGQSTTSPFTVNLNTQTLTDGSHELRVSALDAAGNEGWSSLRYFNVDNSAPADFDPPTVALTAPAQNATVTGTVTISATAQDNVRVKSVTFYLDGTPIGEDTTSPYSMSWNSSTVVNGAHKLEAWAIDDVSNFAASTTRDITVTGGKVINNANAKYTWLATNVFSKRCTTCHGASKSSAGIRLHTYALVRSLVSPPNPLVSALYNSVKTGNMPPGTNDLTNTELKALSDWIELGAPDN